MNERESKKKYPFRQKAKEGEVLKYESPGGA
jgi:hypothetical protein